VCCLQATFLRRITHRLGVLDSGDNYTNTLAIQPTQTIYVRLLFSTKYFDHTYWSSSGRKIQVPKDKCYGFSSSAVLFLLYLHYVWWWSICVIETCSGKEKTNVWSLCVVFVWAVLLVINTKGWWYDYENNLQDALYRLIYYSRSALHVSGDVFTHHQEHLTIYSIW